MPFKITTGNQGVQGVQGAYDEAVPQGVSPATAGAQGVYYDSYPQGVSPATAGVQGVYYEACPQGVPLEEEDAATTNVLASVQGIFSLHYFRFVLFCVLQLVQA